MNAAPFPETASRHPNAGFTLPELLVSAAILALLILLLVGMADGVSRIWRDGERHREAVREVRAGMEVITEDLHSAVLTTNPASLSITQENEAQGGQRLFMLVSHAGDRSLPGNDGGLSVSGYFVAQDPVSGNSLNLYRFHLSGDPVKEALENGGLEKLYASSSPGNTTTTELLARHIIRLTVRRIPAESSASTETSGRLLISLSAIGGESAELLSSAPGTREARELNESHLKKYLQRYTTIVRLPPMREIYSVPPSKS